MPNDPHGSPRTVSPNSLQKLRNYVAADPQANVAYEDSVRRSDLVAALVRGRKRKKLKQAEVAQAMGTTQSAVSELENERTAPQLETMQRYARAIDHKLAVAMVDRDLPIFDEDAATDLWQIVERNSMSQVITSIVTNDGRRSLDELASSARFPRSVIEPIVNTLEAKGWVEREADNSDLYSLGPRAAYVIGIGLTRGRVSGVLLRLEGNVVAEAQRFVTRTSVENVLDACIDVIGQLLAQRDDHRILGIGVSVAGVVNDFGKILFAPDLQSRSEPWDAVEFEDQLQQAVRRSFSDRLRVMVSNDANAIATFEYREHRSNLVSVFLLSEAGIGAGFSHRGQVIEGKNFSAGEGGHLIVDTSDDAPKCRAGFEHRGCLETVASAQGILSTLGLPHATVAEIDDGLQAVNESVRNCDRETIGVIIKAGTYLGRFIVMSMLMLDPDQVAVYGHPVLTGPEEDGAAKLLQLSVQDEVSTQTAKEHNGGRYGAPAELNWRQLTDNVHARAAATAAMRWFLHRPDGWVPELLAHAESPQLVS